MMAAIPQHLVDLIMIKAGRRCFICRRFRPTKLQVHHIQERGKGGTDDEDNLMPICLTCHTDVHSHVPFARRFTAEELKGHRDNLFQDVVDGRLPPNEDEMPVVIDSDYFLANSDASDEERLSLAATELLVASANAKGNQQGRICMVDRRPGKLIFIEDCTFGEGDRREIARYLAGIEELTSAGLIRYESDSMMELTHEGYLIADELASEFGKSPHREAP